MNKDKQNNKTNKYKNKTNK